MSKNLNFRKTILLFFVVFVSYNLFAGSDPDTMYVQKFKNNFSVKTFLLNNGFIYTLTPRNNDNFTEQQLKDAKLFYLPHIPPTTGVSVNIKGIGFSYVFKFTNDYLDTTGRIKSGYKQFAMNMYGTKFGFEAYYQDYSRFYFHYKNQPIHLKDYNTDVRAYQWGARGIFIFNGKKFSYNAAFNQNQLQKKSAGSAMLIIAGRFSELKSTNRTLIPDSLSPYYGFTSKLQRNRNYAFLVQGGYGFNLTKNYFYFSMAALVGVGIETQTFSYPPQKYYRIGFPLVGRGKASVGYNGKILFTGIFANTDVGQARNKSFKTQELNYTYGVYVGVRAIKFTKTKGQIKQEEKRKKLAEKEAAKKAKEAKKKATKRK
ncbi:MAG: DUF4421 domain-containing protein [Sphingobium sp.]|nr:MAG: DUF4421 domain-containing protein [Sphingobium sp.]